PWLSNCASSGFTSSAYSSLYASPEQPDVRTPRRSPMPLPRFAMFAATCRAAFSVNVIAMSVCRGLVRRVRMLGAIVGDGRLDRVLGEDRAVDLDRRQRELLGDLRVADRHRLVEGLALHPLGDERRRRNGGAAAVRLELRILDHAVRADLDLQLHHVAARGCTHHPRADAVVALGERAYV